jgi:hypothetical protein
MSYDAFDAARDEMYEQISKELYPDHKTQAISEFTTSRLQSYYVKNPMVMQPAVEAVQKGAKLRTDGHHAAAVVFFVTAIELFLKATLLKPVVHGLVHNDEFAELIVRQSLGQSGFVRYTALLKKLFLDLVSLDIATIHRPLISTPLIDECAHQQKLRNLIIHQGASATIDEAQDAQVVAAAVFELVVQPMLSALGLWIVGRGEIRVYPSPGTPWPPT